MPTTITERIVEEFNERFRMEDAAREGKGIGHSLGAEIRRFIVDALHRHTLETLTELEGEVEEIGCPHFGHTDGEQLDCDKKKITKFKDLLTKYKERLTNPNEK